MAFIKNEQVIAVNKKLTNDSKTLNELYNAKKSEYFHKTVEHSLVNDHEARGWRVDRELKTKTRLIKDKAISKAFEDQLWCQFYDLQFNHMNIDETLELPFGKDDKDKKQIDVVAIKDDVVFLVECKSSRSLKKAPSYKDEFELLRLRLDGFKKSMEQILDRSIKIKYVFATKNLRLDPKGIDFERFNETRSFYYDDSTNLYIKNLIEKYKGAAYYQFLGLVFKNETISDEKISIPAIEGDMGNKKYYMFSISPEILLKIGFILHRSKANAAEFPTYQRLLKPQRLRGITKFIDEGGYFPNSIIINFNTTKKNKLVFTGNRQGDDTLAKLGTLEIPNAHAIAYIIDGQHRLYGYANSKFLRSNTIPVVAFDGLESTEQLKMFMDINENQTKVSADLRLDLEEDLYWDSDLVASRLKALRSSIVKSLAYSQSGPLLNRISIGEEKRKLSFKPFATALSKSGLMPSARGNKYIDETTTASLYDISNQNHNVEMNRCKAKVVQLINLCYDFVEDNYASIFERERYFIVSDRGTYGFIMLIGSLNKFLVDQKILNKNSTSTERFEVIKKYLDALLKGINNLSPIEEKEQLILIGAGADKKWWMFFESMVNLAYSEFNPQELIDWRERHDQELQENGLIYSVKIEAHLKQVILSTLQKAYEKDWEIEIAKFKRECEVLASLEQEQNYKEGLGNDEVDWQTKFSIMHYKEIIEKFWSNMPTNKIEDSEQFQHVFAIDVGLGFNNKSEKTKWISQFNKYRNKIAHKGTNGVGLNNTEVEFLLKVYSHFRLNEQ
jgi:DNA sulfur modification protein DndB